MVAGQLKVADVRQQVSLTLATDFENYSVFKPGDHQGAHLGALFDEVVAWSTALAGLHDPAVTAAA